MRFSSYAAELEHVANQPDLASCPECDSPLVEKGDEKVCHTCGTRQPIITTTLSNSKTSFLPLLLEGLGALGEAGAAEGAMGAGAAEAGSGGLGIQQMGLLMNNAMSGQGQEEQPAIEPGAAGALGDPGQSMSIAPPGVVARQATMFGEPEVGMATQNRGENSQPDKASETGIEGAAEIGDSPEQNKGVGEDAAGVDPLAGAATDKQHVPGSLSDTASQAFHQNLPLVVQFAFSDQSGADNPILKALDEMLEQANPGYKDGDTFNENETGESPTEKMEETIGQDLDDDGDGGAAEARPKMAPVSRVKEAIPAGSVGFGYQVPGADQVSPGAPGPGGAAPVAPQQNAMAPQQGTGQVCTVCGEMHQPGMCPMAEGLQQGAGGAGAGAFGSPLTPPQPQTVITRAGALDDDLETFTRRDEQEEHHDNRYEDGPGETGWYEDWKGPQDPDDDNPWVDEDGEHLKPGHEYEMVSSQYAIPDKITVEHVGPDKISFLIHSGDVDYRDEIDKEDVANYGYTFKAAKGDELDSESGFEAADAALPGGPPPSQSHNLKRLELTDPRSHAAGYLDNDPEDGDEEQGSGDFFCPLCGIKDSMEMGKPCIHCQQNEDMEQHAGPAFGGPDPVRPGQDALPQQDDLSAPPTKQGAAARFQEGDRVRHVDDATGHAIVVRVKRTAYGYAYDLKDPSSGEIIPDVPDNADLVAAEGQEPNYMPPTTYGDGRQVFDRFPSVQPGDAEAFDPRQGAQLFSNSYTDALGNDQTYTGSFRGDDTDSRSWLMSDSGGGIDVDPGLAAKFAGKDFSPREQRAFIDEEGRGGPARNLHKLDLAETHYELGGSDPYGDALW